MRRVVLAAVAAGVLAGCFGDDGPSRSPEETAQRWVTAINEGDYETACDLSLVSQQLDCVEAMKAKPFGKDLKVEGFYLNENGSADGEGPFALSSSADRKPRGDGWTAYAPMSDGVRIEKRGDEYLVHFEISSQ